jgi:hypothetical protein
MLNNLRSSLPDIEEAGAAAVDRLAKAADIAMQTAKSASELLGEWVKDSADSVKSRPLMWGLISLGFGALIGGLFARWRTAKPNEPVARRAVPARARSKPKKRAPKARRIHPSPDA